MSFPSGKCCNLCQGFPDSKYTVAFALSEPLFINTLSCVRMHASPSPGTAHFFPSLLETLVISNPSLEDFIFKRMPESLKSLTLDFIPQWENMLASSDNLAFHRPHQLLPIFKAMRNFILGGLACIDYLCIKMGWCVTPELLRVTCQLFPCVQTFEIHGIRYFKRAEPTSDMVSSSASFSPINYISVSSRTHALIALQLYSISAR